MPTTKKQVILFIVEGINDDTALALPLEKLLTTEDVKFEVTHGDITSEIGGKDIAAKVGDCVKKHCEEYKYKREDFAEIVLLVDMDGAYIRKTSIEQSSGNAKPYYASDKILYTDPDLLSRIHIVKQSNLNRLINLPYVYRTIPFSVYFFSCNLDHVICDNANLSQREKSREAEAFRKKHYNNPAALLTFFHDSSIKTGLLYDESWNYIKQGLNSLRRLSNFHIFLSPNAIRFPRDFSSII